MANSKKRRYTVNTAQDDPLIMVGPPKKIRGNLRVRNLEEGKLVFRGGEVRVLDAQNGRRKKKPVRYQKALKRIALRAGKEKRVPLTVSLDPHTPPGIYEGEVELEGEVNPVIVQVLENLALSLAPQRLILLNQAGSVQTQRVTVHNTGNVPFAIGEIGAVPLDDDLIYCRVIRGTLQVISEKRADRPAAKPDTGNEHDAPLAIFADAFAEAVDQAAEAFERAGIMRVHNKTGQTIFAPGDRKTLELACTIPARLDRRTRYRGIASLYTADLSFLIVPTTEIDA